MEDSASAFPDWAHLPLAAVLLISQKVKCITDYVRFRAVCSPWRDASLPKPSHLPPQLPWLMIPYMVSRGTVDDGIRSFYDLWESKMRKIPLPETVGKRCCTTHRGWLLLADAAGSAKVILLNPLTRARVQLPPFNIPVKHIWDGDGDEEDNAITKITFSKDLTDLNCVIMVFFQRAQAILHCKVGDLCWTEVVLSPFPNAALTDAAYNNENFYLYYKRAIAIYNLNKHKEQGIYFFQPELKYLPKFFWVGKSGLCMAVLHSDEDRGGDAPLFYGDDNQHYLAVCTDYLDRLVWDSIYREYVYSSYVINEVMLNRIDLTQSLQWRNHEPCYGIFFARMDDGHPEPGVLGVEKMPQIFTPPPSMWFQPSFV